MQTNLLKTFHLLCCPVCRKDFKLNGSSIICESGHNFDISKDGYVNLFNRRVKTGYDKKLFAARRNIAESGFFLPVTRELSEIISSYFRRSFSSASSAVIADCGCGEGSLFSQTISSAGLCSLRPALSLGIDISKDGINYAASKFKNISWLCADLSNIPLKDKSADVILNVLSPANYAGFKRCVKEDGLVLKVIPGEKYLSEIRNAFNIAQNGDNGVRELFYENFKNAKETRITKIQKIFRESKKDILLMTPLTRMMNEKPETDFGDELTLDLIILQAVNKKKN
jgi:23S rRNA (guanine745-N1)-methyltransferase